MISHAFEDLAQALRVFLEAHYKLNSGLINIDRAEAVGNIEIAFNSVINAFHSLYDSIGKELRHQPINWYLTPELCLILAIRNARHHNLANKIRNIFNYHVQNNKNPTDKSTYLIVDFPAPPEEENGDCFDFHLSWADFVTLMSLPRAKSRLKNGTEDLIKKYLNSEAFEEYAAYRNVEKDKIFFNVVPLVLNAGIAIHPHIKSSIKPISTESKHFYWHFEHVCPALTKKHEMDFLEISLPN